MRMFWKDSQEGRLFPGWKTCRPAAATTTVMCVTFMQLQVTVGFK